MKKSRTIPLILQPSPTRRSVRRSIKFAFGKQRSINRHASKVANSSGRFCMKSKGFTLWECLLSLWVLAICLLMISGIVKHLAPVNQQIMARKDQEWHVFLLQLERELSTCTYLSVSETTLYLRSSQNNSVTIDRINRVLRKRDNNGYQPLLTEVADVSFEKIGAAIRFTVSFENGEQKIGQWKIHTQEAA